MKNNNRAVKLQKKAQRQVKRLKQFQGWTQSDFAKALRNLIYQENDGNENLPKK